MFDYKGYWLCKDATRKNWWHALNIKTGRMEYQFAARNNVQAKKYIDDMQNLFGGAK